MQSHEVHIKNTCKDQAYFSICGETVFDFMFEGLDHAYWNENNEGRLKVCPSCLKEINQTFFCSQDPGVTASNEFEKALDDLEEYHSRQMCYAGLLVKAIEEVCDADMQKKIKDRHFTLLDEFDIKESNKNSTLSQ